PPLDSRSRMTALPPPSTSMRATPPPRPPPPPVTTPTAPATFISHSLLVRNSLLERASRWLDRGSDPLGARPRTDSARPTRSSHPSRSTPSVVLFAARKLTFKRLLD